MSRIGFGQKDLAPYAKAGHWNDPDMLEIGNGGMSDIEYRTHMALWSLLAAPLLAGNDLRSMSPSILEILTNREVIAVDQDSLGKQGTKVWGVGDEEVWTRPLADGSMAVGIFNRGATDAPVKVRWADIGLAKHGAVRDLWAKSAVSAGGQELNVTVPSHGVAFWRVGR
jgi:alpha-galactosidase